VNSGSDLSQLIRLVAGEGAVADAFETLVIDRSLADERTGGVSRGVFSMALNAILFQELLLRVPTAAAYVADRRRANELVTFDHGALRTIHLGQLPAGELPAGVASMSRILGPLGYEEAATYPLPKLKMTGRSFVHADRPDGLPQFFVSELHVERFSPSFQAAAQRVFGNTRDPLSPRALAALDAMSERGRCSFDLAVPAMRAIVAVFGRWHGMPALTDYQCLLAESAEAAWIATEGSAFNHATDRVPDVVATAEAQRRLGRPIKDTVEISASGTVRQTAFKADPVRRAFRAYDGSVVELTVPGSFYEFISRDVVKSVSGKNVLDLRFDSGNAQGIFKMTAAE
jgi:Domain of unknown function (DUF1338)